MIIPVDAVQLARLAGDAAQWLAKVVSSRRDRRERAAATVMREAGVLTASMATLDNQLYAAIRKFRAGTAADSPKEGRNSAVRELEEFLGDFALISNVRGTMATLRELTSTPSAVLDQNLADHISDRIEDLLDSAENIVEVYHGEGREGPHGHDMASRRPSSPPLSRGLLPGRSRFAPSCSGT